MNNAYVSVFVICMGGLAAPQALAQRDAYGNKIPADVVRHQAEEAQRNAVSEAMRQRRAIPGMTESEVRSTHQHGHHVRVFQERPDAVNKAGRQDIGLPFAFPAWFAASALYEADRARCAITAF